MRILVTGGAGFIGSHLVDVLIEKGYQVLIIDNLSTGKKEYINPKAKFFKLDIQDFNKIKPLFRKIDFVFHEAAIPSIPLSIDNPKETNEVNLNGTLNVLLASREMKVKKVVFASSSAVYGIQEKLPFEEEILCSPLNPYALQKYVGELYCRIFWEIYKLATVSLRYFNVYGPRQPQKGSYVPVMGVFLRQKAKGEALTVTGDGKQTRDFVYVSDVVKANILAMKSKKTGKGEVINIGSGKNYSINEIAKLIGNKIKYIPAWIGEMRHTLADISLAKKLLSWEPKVELKKELQKLAKT